MRRRVCTALTALAVLGLSSPPSVAESEAYEVVAELEQGPGNVAVAEDGRVFLSQHQFYDPEFSLVELHDGGATSPFPDARWSGPVQGRIGTDAVLGVRATPDGRLWALDNGRKSGRPPRLLAWDIASGQRKLDLDLAPMAVPTSFFQDFAVDPERGVVYIADAASGGNEAIVVIDLKQKNARRTLAGHEGVMPEEDVAIEVDDETVTMKGPDGETADAEIGLGPITLDPTGEWLYFGAMNGTSLYRIKTIDLLKDNLPQFERKLRVERYGDKPVSDGITVDGEGNVYVTDLENDAIGVVRPDGEYERLFSAPEIRWPDGMAFGPDGYVYVTVNQLNESPVLNGGEDGSEPPYKLIRFKPLADGTIER